MVVAVLAFLTVITMPRLSRGTRGTAESALEQDLAVLRRAIEIYAVEHQGAFPAVAFFEGQLTAYTNAQGQVRLTKDSTHIYGPYIRSIPPLPVGKLQGNTKIALADANDVGWIYRPTDGHISVPTRDSRKRTAASYSSATTETPRASHPSPVATGGSASRRATAPPPV